MDRISTKGSIIDQLDLQRVPRSGFDRSFHNFLSSKIGTIVPIRCEEVLPGDRIKGSTHIVANFEPLVGPILGTMVLKQETLYVPQSQLWKNAHNFFTGKKGFNNHIPSVSLLDIYENLNVIQRVGMEHAQMNFLNFDLLFNNFIDELSDTGPVRLVDIIEDNDPDEWSNIVRGFQRWANVVTTDYIPTFAEEFYVVDLLQPLVSIIKDIKVVQNDTIYSFGDSSWSLEQQYDYLVRGISAILDFWFGPSSMLDYMNNGMNDIQSLVKNWLDSMNSQTDAHDFANYFSDLPINWIPFRGNYSCWYWNYRDQLLEPNALDAEEFMDRDTLMFAEIVLLLLVRRRCWFKDMYTTALTNTGNGNIVIPSIASAYSQAAQAIQVGLDEQNLAATSDSAAAHGAGADIQTITIGGIQYSIPSNYLIRSTPYGHFDVTTDNYISLDMIDRAKRLSSWVSKRLALGVEYDDVLYSSFMVKISSVKMRVPELLDASRSTVAINTVVNNTTIPDGQVAGDKTAIAWAENNSDGVNYYAEEHGYLYTYMTIMPIPAYTGGMQRMYMRQNRFDFAWPEFAQMGLDAIYNCELAKPRSIAQKTAATSVFGYQGRYYDYKSKLDECHGRMLTDLSYMTFSRSFTLDAAGVPKLNYIFVHCWPPLDMFVTDDPNIDIVRSIDASFNYHWERVLPVPSEILR